MIRNREQLVTSHGHRVALDCLTAAVAAADPTRLTREAVSVTDGTLVVEETEYALDSYDEIIVLGGGKAAGVVASALASILGDRLSGGVVITDTPAAADRIDILPGRHPVPSEQGVNSTRQLLTAARSATDSTLVIGVITGGGSALMAAPAEGISLSDLQTTTDALLASGATIDEINAVRKHLSAVKGGRLARAAAPAEVCCLVVSDVVGNRLDTIASGPFVADSTTYGDALDVLSRYGCAAPNAVDEHLNRGAAGDNGLTETPSDGDPIFESVTTAIIGDGMGAVQAAADTASDAGFTPLVLSSRIRGEAREAAKTQVAIAEEIRATGQPVEPPAVVVSGGETTVTLRGDGKGGPNQEFVLSAGIELSEPNVVVAAVDTDGIDGPTDVAGGIVDSETVSTEQARDALADNDAYTALDEADALIRTGPTGTNVNDVRAVVVESPEIH